MGKQGSENRCRCPADDHGQVKLMIGNSRIHGIQWLWIVIVLLFPVAATLTPPAPGLCISQNHADCPLPSTLGLEGKGYDAQPVVGQDSCCSAASHISRSGVCRCSKGGSFVPGNAAILFGSDSKVALRVAHVGDGVQAWSGRPQERFSVPFRFSNQPVSLALTMVRVTVLLI